MPMQTGPGPALEVAKTEFLFELLMDLLTGPARLDGGGQTPQRGPRRQVAEVVLPLATVPPFADQPDLIARQAQLVGVGRPVRHADPNGSEAGTEGAFGAMPPGDTPPALLVERHGRRTRRPVRHWVLAGAPGRRARWTQPDRRRIDKLGARDADRPGQPALVQSLAEHRAAAISGVTKHAAEAQPGADHPVDLGQRNPRLGLGCQRRLRHACRITAVLIVGPGGGQGPGHCPGPAARPAPAPRHGPASARPAPGRPYVRRRSGGSSRSMRRARVALDGPA